MNKDRNLVRRASRRIFPTHDTLRSFFGDIFTEPTYEGYDRKVGGTVKGRSQPKTSQEPKEKYYRNKLAKKLGGQQEVVIPKGRIDIVTPNEIIEVKDVKKWKDAVGQILFYAKDRPRHQKRIHLFGDKSSVNYAEIEEFCRNYDIVVSWEDDEF